MSEAVWAMWHCELNCNCPHCGQFVDLLKYEDFWDGRSGVQVCEQGTEQTTKTDVTCPECRKEFVASFEY